MDFPPIVTSTLAVIGLFLGPSIMLVVIMTQLKKRYTLSRTSPLTKDLLRPAGYTLQQQIHDQQVELFGNMLFIPLLILMLAFMTLLQSYLGDKRVTLTQLVMVGSLILGVVGYYFDRVYKTVKRLRYLKLGYACELAVGQELEQLVRPRNDPYRIYHDIPFDGFNIDHLIVSPNGVFVVETKGRSKPIHEGSKQFKVRLENNALHFPNHVETEPLDQVRRNVAPVHKWLASATGSEVPVAGILVLPGWFIERKQASRHPYVLNAAELPGTLPKLQAGYIELPQIQTIAHQVEQKVRDVAKN